MKKNLMLIVALVAMLIFAAPMTTEAAENEGTWKSNAKGWWYEYEDGTYLSDGMFEIGREWYYFDASGYMKTGWVLVEYDYGDEVDEGMEEIPADWYYFKSNGAMAKGWLKDGSAWYYLDPQAGYMWTNCLVDNDMYYVGSDGKMVTDYYFYGEENVMYAFDATGRRVLGGWYQVVEYRNMRWTYIDTDGTQAEGWLKDGGTWYYLDNGFTLIGTYILEYEGQEYLYEFSTSGALIKDVLATKGWIQVDGMWYYYGDTGLVKGDWVYDGAWYYMNEYNGAMRTNSTVWDYADQCYYVVDASGKMVTNGWVKIYDAWVYADGNKGGALVLDDWLKLGTTWYYFDWYYMLEQPTFIDGQLNLFSASGAWLGYSNVTNGWVASGDSWYYLENGQFATGWRSIGGAWYYFDEYSYLAAVDGVWWDNNEVPYLFNQNGAMTSGWYYSDDMDVWFYANPDGTAIVSDWKKIGVTWYYFDYDGWMVEDTIWWMNEEEIHVFAEGGAWLGQIGEYSDGWQYLFGKWYYFEDGYMVDWGLKKIDGQIYAFSNGMIVNDYWFVWDYSSVGTQLGNGTYLVALDGNGHLVKNQWKYVEEFEEWIWFDSYGYGEIPIALYY